MRLLALVALLGAQPGALANAYAQAGPLTPTVLDNATYRPNDTATFGESVQLVNGHHGGSFFSTSIDQSKYVFGDLNGDGSDDAVALVDESLSGVIDGQSILVAAYLNRSAEPVFADSIALGHATNVDNLAINAGVVAISGRYVGPGDPFCCASHPFAIQLKLDGTKFSVLPGSTGIGSPFAADPGPSPDAPAPTDAPDSAQAAPDAAAAPAPDGAGGGPDALTDDVRSDIQAAVDRANAAWTTVGATLDPSGLAGAVGGAELSADQAEIQQLLSQGHRRKSSITSSSITNISLDTPGHAVVKTREAWTEEIDDAATGRVLEGARSATYNETYVVEYVDGGWIVTENDLS